MTEDHYKALLSMLVDTIQAQQQQIAHLTAQLDQRAEED